MGPNSIWSNLISHDLFLILFILFYFIEVAIELFALNFNRGNCYSAKEMSTWTAIFETALPLPLSLVGGSYRRFQLIILILCDLYLKTVVQYTIRDQFPHMTKVNIFYYFNSSLKLFMSPMGIQDSQENARWDPCGSLVESIQ